jgi:diaminopimelate epimerase
MIAGAMRLSFIKCHGSGNDFPLIDARAVRLDDAGWAAVARSLADRAGPVGGDGLLLLTEGDGPGEGDCAFGFRMFNPDGTEAETCLNGLRCVARAGFAALGLAAARVRLRTSVAEVAREPDLAPGVFTVRTVAGPGELAAERVGLALDGRFLDAPIPGLPDPHPFTAIAMPNPHLVRFVARVDEAALVALGQWCEAAPPLISTRANVSFVEQRGPDALFVRTFERGVGLTNSCGSAMAASVLAAVLTGRIAADAPVRVFNKGGLVVGAAGADRRVTIRGNATFLMAGEVSLDLETGTLGEVAVSARHDAEAAAWAAAVAALG